MFARAPASSANLGPGFDTIAVALELYVEVSIEMADSFRITSEGFGAGDFDNEQHLGAVVAADVLGHWNFSIHVNSAIPLSRGLGSSAALALAAAAAAGASRDEALVVATRVDGHAENAAASLLGGLVVASVHERDGIIARPMPLDSAWQFVVVVPAEELATADARRVLPATIAHADAVHNLNSFGLLLAGLADHRAFASSAMDDYLHQPYRMELLPFAQPLLDELRRAGCAGSCWSGAGSTMLGLTTAERAEEVVRTVREFLDRRSIAATVGALSADRTGLVVR